MGGGELCFSFERDSGLQEQLARGVAFELLSKDLVVGFNALNLRQLYGNQGVLEAGFPFFNSEFKDHLEITFPLPGEPEHHQKPESREAPQKTQK